ncbi:MAG: hypothetical protein RIQ92_198, partial [Actinomycetota bacterium]
MLTAPNVDAMYLHSYAYALNEESELLCLTEDTVDLGTADWADALCHA